MIAFALGGLFERRLRFAETLTPVEHLVEVLQVSAAGDADPEIVFERGRPPAQRASASLPSGDRAFVRRRARHGRRGPERRRHHGRTSPVRLPKSYARAADGAHAFHRGRPRSGLRRGTDAGWSDIPLGARRSSRASSSAIAGLWVVPAGSAGVIDDRAGLGADWCARPSTGWHALST